MPNPPRSATAALLLAALLLCLPSPTTARQADPAPKPEPARVVYVVRHAEAKQDAGRDPALTAEGVTRADRLARVLADERLSAVFVTPTKRSLQTGAPAATGAGVEPTTYRPFDTDALIAHINELPPASAALVIAHSNTTPAIVKALAGEHAPKALKDLAHDEHDPLFAIVLNANDPPRVLRLRY